jgi:predicted unusual protein kinase regulating ubiquinone biosynthesis (AarF/ABC1/UbiB family)
MTDGPVTKGRRFFKLASMTAQVAGSYASTRIKSIFQSEEAAARDRSAAHELNGSRIARTLGELKGAVMKVGQMASIAGDILPRSSPRRCAACSARPRRSTSRSSPSRSRSELGARPSPL